MSKRFDTETDNMKIQNTGFLPDSSLDSPDMEELQIEIAEKAVFEDDFPFSPGQKLKVAGIDQAFLEDKVISTVVVVQGDEVVERVKAVEDLEMPYIPGLLAFREATAIVTALQKLSVEPDILMLDGNGRIHYREAGIATHIGVLFDTPAIGVGKNLLCGELVRKTDHLEEGEKVPIHSDENMNTEKKELIGYAFQSRQYTNSYRINPIYISPGHRVSAETSVEIVEKFCEGYKLPEPTRLADQYADEVKKSL
ncbi:MAG: deoxyribonuclease V [Candidatus Nanohaloarchaea archaeon]